MSLRITRRAAVATLAALGAITLAACTVQKPAEEAKPTVEITNKAKITPVASVTDGQTDVSVNSPILVSAGDALTDVTLSAPDGTSIAGSYDALRHQWTSTDSLDYSTTYTLTATAHDQTTTASFTTLSPTDTVGSSLAPLDGSTVGIGQTIAIRFDQIVENRKAIQDAIHIETTPHVDGAFYWISSQEVRWRPEKFWTPGTKVTVDANLYGLNVGDGAYVSQNRHASFTIGDALIATADDNTKQLVIEKNGEVIKSMPISMGNAANPTPNGIYFLGDHNPSMIMDSTTFGLALDAGGYRSTVNYATQMSYSGIYVHSAPWSIGQQGYSNVSHGCLNVSPDNAKWFMDNTNRGDIVIVKNTIGGQLPGTDGLGDWNIDWDTWKAGNANV